MKCKGTGVDDDGCVWPCDSEAKLGDYCYWHSDDEEKIAALEAADALAEVTARLDPNREGLTRTDKWMEVSRALAAYRAARGEKGSG